MAAIEALVLIAAAGIAIVIVALLTLITRGIRQEERAWTLGRAAPTATARFARRVLGAWYPASPLDQALSLDEALRSNRQLADTDA